MMLALAGARNVRPALLMLGAVGCIHARGQKTFLLNLYCYIDTQGRGVHGPDERLPANDGKRLAGGRP